MGEPNPSKTVRRAWVPGVVGAVLVAMLTGFGFVAETGARTGPALGTLRIGTARATVELPVGANALRLGLSERDAVARGTDGMYFRAYGMVGFGMEGMRFCLDFIWIDGDQVIGVSENICPAPPGSSPESPAIYYPPGPLTAAVETPAGWVAEHGIAAGDPVTRVAVSHRMVFGMVKRAARDNTFVESETTMVSGALAYAGVDWGPMLTQIDAADDDGKISTRELRRIRLRLRSQFSDAKPSSPASDRQARGSASLPS